MRNLVLPTAMALLLASGLAAQQGGAVRPDAVGAQAGGAAALARRQALQRQILGRFMDRASNRLGLNAADRRRLERVMLTGEVRRRELAREARQALGDLRRAARDSSTSDAEYDRLLQRMADLRARDLELWRSEQAQLARVLTPRQRAEFMAMRIEFAELVQRVRGGVGGAGPPGPP